MDVALIEHAEHDVDGDDSCQDQPGLPFQRGAELGGLAGERAGDGVGHANLLLGLRDGRDGLVQGLTLRQVETDGVGGELFLVADGKGRRFSFDARDGRQGNLYAIGSRRGQDGTGA